MCALEVWALSHCDYVFVVNVSWIKYIDGSLSQVIYVHDDLYVHSVHCSRIVQMLCMNWVADRGGHRYLSEWFDLFIMTLSL